MPSFLEQIFGGRALGDRPDVESLNPADVPEEIPADLYERFDVREMEMIGEIRETVESDERLKLENWRELETGARREVLQELENRIAAIESRSPMRIIVEDMGPCTCGYTNYNEGIIAINTTEVSDDSISGLRELVDTVVHEGRHAYQHQNVYGERTELNDAKFNGWVENFRDGYLDQRLYGFEAYRAQPLEADAWAFAEEVVSDLCFR